MTAPSVRSRLRQLLGILQKTYPEAQCALNFTTPLELLIATILSAQCTDVRVNLVTPRLFHKYRTAADYVGAAAEELAQDIQSTGFYRQKTSTIQRCCVALVQQHTGAVKPARLRHARDALCSPMFRCTIAQLPGGVATG